MKTARKPLLAGIMLTLALGACSKDDPVEPDEGLTKDEAVALLMALKTTLGDTTQAPIHASQDSIVLRCHVGGQTKLVGGVEDKSSQNKLQVVMDFVVTPRACQPPESNGNQFTLTGNPSFRDVTDIGIVLDDSMTFDISGSAKGKLGWELGSGSGDCDIDVTLKGGDLDTISSKVKGTYKGSMCGHEVEVVVDLGVQTGADT